MLKQAHCRACVDSLGTFVKTLEAKDSVFVVLNIYHHDVRECDARHLSEEGVAWIVTLGAWFWSWKSALPMLRGELAKDER